MRARFPILLVVLLATYACIGGPISDTPSVDPGGGQTVPDAGARGEDEQPPATPGGGGISIDAGSAAGSQDAAAPSQSPCAPRTDAGDAGDAGLTVDDAGDAWPYASDSAVDAASASDAQGDTGASPPDATSDAQALAVDAAGDAPYTPSNADACVR